MSLYNIRGFMCGSVCVIKGTVDLEREEGEECEENMEVFDDSSSSPSGTLRNYPLTCKVLYSYKVWSNVHAGLLFAVTGSHTCIHTASNVCCQEGNTHSTQCHYLQMCNV